jgi:hypothetical protein
VASSCAGDSLVGNMVGTESVGKCVGPQISVGVGAGVCVGKSVGAKGASLVG